jgi:hypothetical protein
VLQAGVLWRPRTHNVNISERAGTGARVPSWSLATHRTPPPRCPPGSPPGSLAARGVPYTRGPAVQRGVRSLACLVEERCGHPNIFCLPSAASPAARSPRQTACVFQEANRDSNYRVGTGARDPGWVIGPHRRNIFCSVNPSRPRCPRAATSSAEGGGAMSRPRMATSINGE